MIGAQDVVRASADGYTLLVASNTVITAAPHLHSHMPFDTQKDLTPLLMLGQITPVMNVAASLPVHSVQELIALAKAKPGELDHGSFGNGGYAHVAMEDFKRRTGTQILHVPYKGATPAITALIRGEVGVVIVNLSSIAPHVKSGAARIIASAGENRTAFLPDLPTVESRACPASQETGAWWGLWGPANLPPPVVDKIRTDVTRALATPEARTLFETNTFALVSQTPAQFVNYIRDDLDNWGKQIKAAGIEPD